MLCSEPNSLEDNYDDVETSLKSCEKILIAKNQTKFKTSRRFSLSVNRGEKSLCKLNCH